MTMTLGQALAAVEEADKNYATASAVSKSCNELLDAAKAALQELMLAQGTDTARNENITVTIVDKERPHVQDWDAFHKFLRRTGDLQLLERRVAAKAFTEILEKRNGKELPGVTVFKYQQLSIRRG